MRASALKVNRNWILSQRVQRRILIKVAAAYKTVSTIALPAITRIPPIVLLEEKRKYINEQKGEISG